MKKLSLFALLLLAFHSILFSQDYKVASVEHLQNDMTARKTILTEKVNGGQQCAVLRISTQNILDPQRDVFQFECDMGSVIRERRKDGGEICLWVSPGIKILKIKHNTLGNYILNIPDMLNENVQSLHTYRITIVGLKELPKEVLSYGKSQMVFLPYPKNASLFINGDSIGAGTHTITSLPGNYRWSIKHPLYHTSEGTLTLSSGQIDTIYENLIPAYGYMKITGNATTTGGDDELKVYVNGLPKGYVPYTSDKMAPGIYNVALEAGNQIKAMAKLEVKERMVCLNKADDLCLNYIRTHNNPNAYGNVSDTSFLPERSMYYPMFGKVTITSMPESAVLIDGTDYGTTPITIDSLSVGKHQLELTAKSHTALAKEIIVEEGIETTYRLKLKHSCVATIVTDKAGDQVYIDKAFIGKTPLTIERPFGTYSIYIIRPGHFGTEEEITLSPDNLEPTFDLSFGQTINVASGNKKAKLYVDNEYIGRTPNEVYIYNGPHKLKAEYGWSVGEKDIVVSRDSYIGDLNIETHSQKPTSFLSNGAFFMTGNLGFFKTGKSVFGFNVGDIAKGGHAGWYLSIMANGEFIRQMYNRDFSVLNAYLKADENGVALSGEQQVYTDEQSLIRASALFGVALRVAGPVYLRAGGGYGIRRNTWKAGNDTWVVIDPYSWKDFECTLGLQCCIYNIVFNTDVLIPVQEVLVNNKRQIEFRAGLGFCLKHKK